MSSKKALIDCVLNAAVEASHDSEEADLTLDEVTDRNEQWIGSYAAIRLNDLARKASDPKAVYVTSEARVSWLPAMCNVDNPRNVETALARSKLTAGRKFDLAVWNDDGVVGLLEIKNAPGMDSNRFEDDLKKLDAALNIVGKAKGSTLKWGIYLFSVRLTKNGKASNIPIQELLDNRRAGISCKLHSNVLSEYPLEVITKEGWALGWGAIFLEAEA